MTAPPDTSDLQVRKHPTQTQFFPWQARLADAREVLLSCQQLLERHQPTLATGPGGGGAGAAGAAAGGGGSGPPSFGLLPGLHLLTGQYCVATGEYGAAAAHFEVRSSTRGLGTGLLVQ